MKFHNMTWLPESPKIKIDILGDRNTVTAHKMVTFGNAIEELSGSTW